MISLKELTPDIKRLGDAIASVPDAISWNNEVITTPTDVTIGTDTQAAPPQASQSGDLPSEDPK